jgi:hypothetical protein
MERISPPADTPRTPTETQSEPVLTTVLLGIGATLLALFVEFQLLRATNLPLKYMAAGRSTSVMSVADPDSELIEAKQPSLRVRARSIDTNRRTSPVYTGTSLFE